MVLHGYFIGTALVLYRHYKCALMVLCWYFTAAALVPHWSYIGATMVLRCGLHPLGEGGGGNRPEPDVGGGESGATERKRTTATGATVAL